MPQQLVPYLAIPLTTLLLAGNENWLTSNFSVIGSQGLERLVFLGWGLLIGCYFHRQLGRLIPALGGGRWLHRGRHLALFLLLCALLIPYLPQTAPLQAAIHVMLALTATLLLFSVVLGLLLQFQSKSGQAARPYLLAMAVIGAVVSVLLAVAGMVSTALETFLVLSNVTLLQQLSKHHGI